MRDITAYEKPLKDFLSKFMHKNRNPEAKALASTTALFENTCSAIVDTLGVKPFHVRAGLNAAVFDSVMVAFSKHLISLPKNLSSRYKSLIADKEYDKATRTATTDKENIDLRFQKADSILFG